MPTSLNLPEGQVRKVSHQFRTLLPASLHCSRGGVQESSRQLVPQYLTGRLSLYLSGADVGMAQLVLNIPDVRHILAQV